MGWIGPLLPYLCLTFFSNILPFSILYSFPTLWFFLPFLLCSQVLLIQPLSMSALGWGVGRVHLKVHLGSWLLSAPGNPFTDLASSLSLVH